MADNDMRLNTLNKREQKSRKLYVEPTRICIAERTLARYSQRSEKGDFYRFPPCTNPPPVRNQPARTRLAYVTMTVLAVMALSAGAMSLTPPPWNASKWELVMLTDAVGKGAVCLGVSPRI